MYAFVVIASLAGAPQPIIMVRGLTESECKAKTALPDSGLRIDGAKVSTVKRCIPEKALPSAPQVDGT